MIYIRLDSCKKAKGLVPEKILDNLPLINELLAQNTHCKKRNEELLKKNFKTIINVMLEQFEHSQKLQSSQKVDYKKLFLQEFFGESAREYNKLFSTIQMNQSFYLTIFKFAKFQQSFKAASKVFMETFLEERQVKTENFVTTIYSRKTIDDNKEKLRSPWSIEEARASMSAMANLLNQA